MRELAREALVELHFQWLLFVVLITLLGLAVKALLAVQQVARLIPDIAQGINVEGEFFVTGFHYNVAAVRNGIAYLGKAYTLIFHELFELLLVLVAHLDYYARVLGEQCFDDVRCPALGGVRGDDVVQIDVHAALGVGETHLKQGGDESSGRDVVAGHDPPLFYHLLDGHKGVGKIFGILHRGNVAAYLAQYLC